MILLIPETQENILKIEVGGRLTKEDYTKKFTPKVAHMLREHDKICLLIIIDSSFVGMDMAAAWEDTHFGVTHRHDFEKIAIVGETGWMKWASNLASAFMDGDVRFFESFHYTQAVDWIKNQNKPNQKRHSMTKINSCVAVFKTHVEAENAIKELQ